MPASKTVTDGDGAAGTIDLDPVLAEDIRDAAPSEPTADAAVAEVSDEASDAADAAEESAAAEGAAESDAAEPTEADPSEQAAAEPTNVPWMSDAQRAGKPRRWIPAVAACAVIIALAVPCGLFAWWDSSASSQADKRQQFIETAKQVVLNMTSIHADAAGNDVQRVIDMASGAFRDQLTNQKDPVVQVVQQAQVVADGQIVSAGVEKESTNEATVLVASEMMVKNAGIDTPQSRDFRFRVTVHDDGGKMTVTNLEAVA